MSFGQGKSIRATYVLINTTRVTALKKSLKSLQQTQNGVFRYNTSLPLAGLYKTKIPSLETAMVITYLSQLIINQKKQIIMETRVKNSRRKFIGTLALGAGAGLTAMGATFKE